MKRLYLLIITFLLWFGLPEAQVIRSTKIDSILNLVSLQNICMWNRELSGDTLTTIGGLPHLIYSRAWNNPENVKAAQYIFEKFQSFGLSPKYMSNSSTNINVYAVKTGTKYPGKKFIIGAHYDNLLYELNPGLNDTIHGADDNSSGVCGVLEAARLLASMPLDFTVIFVAFDEEEAPVILSGSKGFADSCFFKGDSLIGMLNLDMIGWDGNNDNKFAVILDTNSYIMEKVLYNCLQSYQINLNLFERYNDVCDQTSFWIRGYKAITIIEEARNYFNPYYHTIGDTFDKFNIQFFYKLVKAAIATTMTYALNLHFDLYHKQLNSTVDTSSRTAKIYITFPSKIATGVNAPRLYYRTTGGTYSCTNPSIFNDTDYYFTIPGFPSGTKIFYYFAAQDSAGANIVTLPNGGSGINPPGTTPPITLFSYDILSYYNQCSNTLPKTINDFQYTYDTIQVNLQNKIINKLKINLTIYHPNDGDLIIQLKGPNGVLNISQNNGSGGANYINTTFDDSASIPITQGIPPYTGSYRPQSALSYFNNQSATAPWILRVFDSRTGNTGTLVSWCILMQLKNSVGIKEENIPIKYELYQNYPNPFNPATNIKYQIAKSGFVTLKIYDILGKEIQTLVSEKQSAGEYLVIFNGDGLPSGVYLYKLDAGDFKQTRKLILLK